MSFKGIANIVGLVSTIFVIVSYLSPLFFTPVFVFVSLNFEALIEHFMILFSLFS